MPADSVLAKAPYRIPTVADTDRVCVSVSVPNDPDHLANFFTALASLGLWSNYRLESDRIAKPVADVWAEIFRISEESLCDCGLRMGPFGIEQFKNNTGTWVPVNSDFSTYDPRTDGTVPAPWSTVPAGQDAHCLSAANIVQTFKAGMEYEISVLAAADEFAIAVVGIVTVLGLAIPVVGEIFDIALALAGGVLTATTAAMSDSFVGTNPDTVYEHLKFIIFCHSQSDGSITAADIAAINADLHEYLPGPLAPIDGTLFEFMWDGFTEAWGPNGMTRAATSSAIVSADCSGADCGWVSTLYFTADAYSSIVDVILGTWSSGVGYNGTFYDSSSVNEAQLSIDVDSCTITGVRFVYNSVGGSGPNNSNEIILNHSIYGTPGTPVTGVDQVYHQHFSIVPSVTNIQAAINSGTDAGPVTLTQLEIRGTGTKPSQLP